METTSVSWGALKESHSAWICSIMAKDDIIRAVTVTVTTASPAVVGCHRGCLLPPAVVHVTSHTL